jgi:hypothetical protein
MPGPCTKKPAATKSKAGKARSGSLFPSKGTSYAKQHQRARENCKKHGKVRNTNTNYDGHIWRGRDWVHQFSCEEAEAEQHWKAEGGSKEFLSADDDSDKQHTEELQDPDFHRALDAHPIACTPLAISMYLSFKCFDEDHGDATARAVYSAFIRHYDQM